MPYLAALAGVLAGLALALFAALCLAGAYIAKDEEKFRAWLETL